MTKVFKNITLITLVAVSLLNILLAIFSCFYRHNYGQGKAPWQQKGSEWMSEDSTMKIYEAVDSYSYLTVNINGIQEEFVISWWWDSGEAAVYPYECSENNFEAFYDRNFSCEKYELWKTNFKTPDKFTITVLETTFLKEGQKIDFVKTKDGDLTRYRVLLKSRMYTLMVLCLPLLLIEIGLFILYLRLRASLRKH